MTRVNRPIVDGTVLGAPRLESIVVSSGSVTLHAVAAGPPAGPLLLLLHGFPEFWFGWRHQIGALAEAGFRVVAPDQRGYARSSKPQAVSDYSVDLLAADVVAVAEALRYTRFDVIGHDWGGIVAWWTALEYPDRVARLVAINAPHPLAARRFARRHWTQFARSWYVLFLQLPGVPERILRRANFAVLRRALTSSAPPGLFSTADLQRYRDAWAEPGALTGMINWYRALRRDPTIPVNRRVAQPTLILWGDRDRFLDPRLADASRDLCQHASLFRFRNASHWVHHECAEEVNAKVMQFLMTQAKRGGAPADPGSTQDLSEAPLNNRG